MTECEICKVYKKNFDKMTKLAEKNNEKWSKFATKTNDEWAKKATEINERGFINAIISGIMGCMIGFGIGMIVTSIVLGVF